MEPISSPWKHTGTVAAAANNAAVIFAASQGVELPLHKADDYIPQYVAQADQSPRMTADQVREVMEWQMLR